MRKIGHIYCASGEWTHASTPTVMALGNGYFRVYFASRDYKNRGHIFSLEFDIRHPLSWLNSRGPLLGPGVKGSFDDSGLSPACVWGNDLYYLGWNLGVTAPFRNSIGVAHIFGDELMGHDYPVLDRSEDDPLTIAYPWVMDKTMWYSSNLAWGSGDQDMHFVMKRATLRKGWENKKVVMELAPDETALVRPSVLYEDGLYRMWYAIKKDKYSIGYAESYDGSMWNRLDNVGLKPSDGFDSEEVTYPCVFKHEGKTYMLYNGNRYGKTGFGIAVDE